MDQFLNLNTEFSPFLLVYQIVCHRKSKPVRQPKWLPFEETVGWLARRGFGFWAIVSWRRVIRQLDSTTPHHRGRDWSHVSQLKLTHKINALGLRPCQLLARYARSIGTLRRLPAKGSYQIITILLSLFWAISKPSYSLQCCWQYDESYRTLGFEKLKLIVKWQMEGRFPCRVFDRPASIWTVEVFGQQRFQ